MTYGMYFPVLLCVFIPVRFYPIPLGFAASALKLSFRTLQSFPSCWTKTAAMRELVHVQGGHIFTVCSVVVGHHESFDLDLLFAYTIWTSIHMYWQHLLLITVHWVQLTKIEDFHWTRLFCFTSNGKVSAATRSEPSSGRSLRMNMALTPLVLGLNDWLPLYGCLFLRSAVGLEWIKINEVLCGDELRFWYYIFFGCRWQGPCFECSIRWTFVCQNDLWRKLKVEFANETKVCKGFWRKFRESSKIWLEHRWIFEDEVCIGHFRESLAKVLIKFGERRPSLESCFGAEVSELAEEGEQGPRWKAKRHMWMCSRRRMSFDGHSNAQMSLVKLLFPTKNSHMQSSIGPRESFFVDMAKAWLK